MLLRDLSTGERFEVELGDQIDGGGQGRVYALQSVNGRRAGHLLKLYTSVTPREREHLAAFVRHVDRSGLRRDMLAGLPQHAVSSDDGTQLGFFTYRVPGQSLDPALCERLFDGAHLEGRLAVAAVAAEGLSRLHAARIVHADFNYPNVVVDPAVIMAYPIDTDGGGVLTRHDDGKYVQGLEPLTTGKREGSCAAPELFDGRVREASVATDLWSLAVLLHQLLFAGLDPFFAVPTFAEALQPSVAWPPHSAWPDDSWAGFHERVLRSLGRSVRDLFGAVFQQNRIAEPSEPSLRPQASDWASALDVASRWTMRCSACGGEFVAERRERCPTVGCGRAVDHATAALRRSATKHRLIDHDGMSILGRELGFVDDDGRYAVALLRRRNRRIEVRPCVPIEDMVWKRTYLPADPKPLLLGPGSHRLKMWSRDHQNSDEVALRVRG
jgi:DNA-binding helix-hairpin-helix protein with protein kinase domain